MDTGIMIWYGIVAVVGFYVGGLWLAAIIKVRREQKRLARDAERGENSSTEAPEAPGVLPLLQREFRAVRMANEGDYNGRHNLGVLSTIIQKLDRGEAVDNSAIVFLLSRLRGTEKLIEKIKEEGA